MPRPYKMWLYPIPSFIGSIGWIFILRRQRAGDCPRLRHAWLGVIFFFVCPVYRTVALAPAQRLNPWSGGSIKAWRGALAKPQVGRHMISSPWSGDSR